MRKWKSLPGKSKVPNDLNMIHPPILAHVQGIEY